MNTPVSKIMGLIDKLSDQERAMIGDSYYMKPEKELSPKVTKLKKVFDKLDSVEQSDFVKLVGARMVECCKEEEAPAPDMLGVVIEGEGEMIEPTSPEESPKEGEDLYDK